MHELVHSALHGWRHGHNELFRRRLIATARTAFGIGRGLANGARNGGENAMTTAYPKRNLVCFKSAFAYEGAANITHMTLDDERTACGRVDWATEESWHDMGPDCLVCHRAWNRLPESERKDETP